MSEEETTLQRATIEQAKAAWEAHPDPSLRGVCAALKASGFFCSLATMQRWHKSEWVLKGKARNIAKKSPAAQTAVADGVKKRDDEAAAAEKACQNRITKLVAELEKLTEGGLAGKTTRKAMIARCVLAEEVIRMAPLIAVSGADKVAKLIEVLGNQVVAVAPSAPAHGNGDDAKVINGREIKPKSESAIAIEAFLKREGVAA